MRKNTGFRPYPFYNWCPLEQESWSLSSGRASETHCLLPVDSGLSSDLADGRPGAHGDGASTVSTVDPGVVAASTAGDDDVLFNGTRYSNLYTAVDTSA